MITAANIEQCLARPETVSAIDRNELERLVDLYPYCEPLRWILLRHLFQSNDLAFDSELQRHGIYIADRRSLYYYITYSPTSRQPGNSLSDMQVVSSSVDYFELTQNPESANTLQELAAKLRAARLAHQAKANTGTTADSEKNPSTPTAAQTTANTTTSDAYSPQEIQSLIRQKKYSTALEILRSINLNNPKKSAYFALQIKYLETIINNQNKTE